MFTLGGVAILIEEVPHIEFRNGVFYRTVELGNERLCLAMRPATFRQAILCAQDVYAKWQLEELTIAENIVRFQR